MAYQNLSEEAVKNKIRERYFSKFSTSGDFNKIDFTVAEMQIGQQELFSKTEIKEREFFLWAEAKKSPHVVEDLLTQLILTIGAYKITENTLPPKYLGAFDNEKIAFVEYSVALPIFNMNDFNWNVTPSNTKTAEFAEVKEHVNEYLTKKQTIFYYDKDEKGLKAFIKKNFVKGDETGKIQITKNNFVDVYYRWCEIVKPTIKANWQIAKKNLILDSDFYLADLFVDESQGKTIQESLKVILQNNLYTYGRKINEMGMLDISTTSFTDDQKAYSQFWNKYSRPPRKEFWNYFLSRRDLLVPQDIRERKGAFFTPPQWADLSKKYLADYLGENWQDEYYIWDCCCGTGNLEIGLTNNKNIFASTLDSADIDIIKQLIKDETVTNLFEDHVFTFDFLNDDFIAQKDGGKLPNKLAEIINDSEKRKKLVIYINPPYAEAGTTAQTSGTGKNKTGVTKEVKYYSEYTSIIGEAARELFALFFMRVYKELNGCILGQFSTLKTIQSKNFEKFLNEFNAKLESLFIVPGYTFDNVEGKFPIGFFIWNLSKNEIFSEIVADIYEIPEEILTTKSFKKVTKNKRITDFLKTLHDKKTNQPIAYLCMRGADFQNQNFVNISLAPSENDIKKHLTTIISPKNLIPISVYFAVRHAIPHTWLNHNDQFLYPNDDYKTDKEFQSDCLMFTLFHGKNRISTADSTRHCEKDFSPTKQSTSVIANEVKQSITKVDCHADKSARNDSTIGNHWLPFTETELGIHTELASSFMQDFIAGKIKDSDTNNNELFESDLLIPTEAIQFSAQAQEVRNAALQVFRYYHQIKPNAFEPYNVNASLYDIKAAFKGRNEKGKMNAKSADETFNFLMNSLQESIKNLAKKIEPKIYEYGFLL